MKLTKPTNPAPSGDQNPSVDHAVAATMLHSANNAVSHAHHTGKSFVRNAAADTAIGSPAKSRPLNVSAILLRWYSAATMPGSDASATANASAAAAIAAT